MVNLLPTLAGMTFPVIRSPNWRTDTHRTITGKRTTLAWQSVPWYNIEIPYSFLRATATAEFQDLLAFYNSANGPANVFRFNDPDSNTATALQFGTGDGATRTFQLLTRIQGASFNWNDPVYFTNTASIFDNAVLKTLGVDYTLTSGLVTFTVAPIAGHVLTWTGTFDWLCRFTEDMISFEKFVNSIWELKALKFSTEKL